MAQPWEEVRQLAYQVALQRTWPTESRTVRERVQVVSRVRDWAWLGLRTRDVVTVESRDVQRPMKSTRVRVVDAPTFVLDDNGRFTGPLDGEVCERFALDLMTDGTLMYCTWRLNDVDYPTYVPAASRLTGWRVATDDDLVHADLDWIHREHGVNRRGGTHYWRAKGSQGQAPGRKLTQLLQVLG